MIGTSFGRYEIEGELGHGGMSVVYRGVDTSLGRQVAIKVLHSHLAKKLENRKRLHREAQAIARLKHPDILEVYDYADEDADRAYIVMEYVQGQNLREFLEEHGAPPPEHCALIGLHISRALAHAHAHGIIHRDLKPENVMVSQDGTIRLMDFGIAHVFDAETMTQTGSLLGSPAHMAPEMIEGERVDVRADLFALGTVLYWMATEALPFDGKSAPQVLKRVLEGLFKNPEVLEPRIGQRFGDIIRKCLAYEPEERYQSAEALACDLEEFAWRIGFEDLDEELRRFLQDPQATRAHFEQLAPERLIELGERALEREEPAEAFRCFNRVLAYDPKNARVRRHLDELSQPQLGLAHWAAAAAAVLALSVGAWLLWGPGPEPVDARVRDGARAEGPALDAGPSQAAQAQARELGRMIADARAGRARHQARLGRARARSSEDAQLLARAQRDRAAEFAAALGPRQLTPVSVVRGVEASPDPRRGREPELRRERQLQADMGAPVAPEPETEVPAEPEPATYLYKFRLPTPAARLTIEGKTYEAHEALAGIELTHGHIYTARVRSPKCKPRMLRLRPTRPQTKPQPIRLEWKPGTVYIRADKKSWVTINDSQRKKLLEPGKRLRHEVDFGPMRSARQPTQPLRILVREYDNLTNTFEQTIRVVPDTTQNVDARL